MNDAGALIRTSLLTTSLTSIVGSGSTARLWANRVIPITGYKPADGIAIAFRVRGGGTMYRNGMMYPSVQFKCWGVDEITANTGYRALVDVLHDNNPGSIRSAYLEQLGQTAQEADTLWPFVLVFFTIWLPI